MFVRRAVCGGTAIAALVAIHLSSVYADEFSERETNLAREFVATFFRPNAGR
jgi:hypothetical protein